MPPLDPVEARVLGALVEKELATPEYYPMSLSGLVTACNQKTNREPVMELGQGRVARALEGLSRRGLTGTADGAGSRVEKYRHTLKHGWGLDEAERAALALLLLRGPQTAGEVRSRSGRLHDFEDLDAAEAALRRLAEREEPLAVELPLQPGRSAARWAHLLSGEPEETEAVLAHAPAVAPAMEAARADAERLAALEAEVGTLREEVEALREAFAAFREQFE